MLAFCMHVHDMYQELRSANLVQARHRHHAHKPVTSLSMFVEGYWLLPAVE